MNLRAMMTLGPKGVLLLSSVSAALFGCGAIARANDLSGGGASPQAKAMCAAYGPGFTAIEGSDTCVFIGGHVRVGFGSRGGDSPDTGWATGTAVRVNAASSSSGAPGHLRLPGDDDSGTLAR